MSSLFSSIFQKYNRIGIDKCGFVLPEIQFKSSLVCVDICNYDLIEKSESYKEGQEKQEYEV